MTKIKSECHQGEQIIIIVLGAFEIMASKIEKFAHLFQV